jgi:inorganic pyrophosphatase
MMFPYASGFVPRTKAPDGDPEDVLILMEEATFAGCVVPSRLIGVLEAEQTKSGRIERNDRLIAVAMESRDHSHVQTLKDLNQNMVNEIEQFFINYNRVNGKQFKVLAKKGPQQARKLLEKSLKAAGNP